MSLLRNVSVLNNFYAGESRISASQVSCDWNLGPVYYSLRKLWAGLQTFNEWFVKLIRTKESMARDYSDKNWSRKFRYEPLIKVMLRSILHWKKISRNFQIISGQKKKERMFSAHTTTVVNGGRQIWMDLDHVITKSLIKPPKNWKSIDVSFFTSSENLSTKNQVNF